MGLAFLLAGIQSYLVVGIFNFTSSTGTMIPNLAENFVFAPVVDWLVALVFGSFVVLVPLYFRIRGGKATYNTSGMQALAVVPNVLTVILWIVFDRGHILFASAITPMIMTIMVNIFLAVGLYILLIYKLFPD